MRSSKIQAGSPRWWLAPLALLGLGALVLFFVDLEGGPDSGPNGMGALVDDGVVTRRGDVEAGAARAAEGAGLRVEAGTEEGAEPRAAPEAVLVLDVRDAGRRPVRGVDVYASREVIRDVPTAEAIASGAIRHARTSATGQARVTGLRAGPCWILVANAEYCAVDERFDGRAPSELGAGTKRLDAIVKQVHAALVDCRGARGVRVVSSTVSGVPGAGWSAVARAIEERARQRLRSQYAQHVVAASFVGTRLRRPSALVDVLLSDGSVLSGDVVLQPMDRVRAARVPRVRRVVMRRVVVDVDREQLPESSEWSFVLRCGPLFRFECTPGRALTLPCDDYDVHVPAVPGQDEWAPSELQVRRGVGVQRVHLDLGGRYRFLRFESEPGEGARLDLETQSGVAWGVGLDAAGACRVLVPVGELQARVIRDRRIAVDTKISVGATTPRTVALR